MPSRHSTVVSIAQFSDDELHRYSLTRTIQDVCGSNLLFVLLNPSTADALLNDRTLMNCQNIAFGHANGGVFGQRVHAFRVCNLYSLISTNPRCLIPVTGQLHIPEQRRNDCAIREACRWADNIVCAWGQELGVRRRLLQVMPILLGAGKPLWRLGMGTKEPLHPSRGAEGNALERYEP